MTETTPTEQAKRRERYAAAISKGGFGQSLRELTDAAIAVADAEQAGLLTRISELESSCRDVDRLRKDWVEMHDRAEELDERAKGLAAATVPASAPAAPLSVDALAPAIHDAALATNPIPHPPWGQLDAPQIQRFRTMAALVIERLARTGRADGETQQDETQAEAHLPTVEWHIETKRRGDLWVSWSCVRYELADAQSAFAETVTHDRGRHAWRLIRQTTTYAVEAEQPAAVSQPDGEA
ncbi:hypothetical protein [Streptomyces sp. SAS_275]|uniref:hypothetical protein n=1 Tax=Streptomyces sp. SAS_275 TaxID=3412746 RepID=UPI00403CA7DF